MEQTVRYYWILEQANHSCPNHTIHDVNFYIHFQNLLLKCREFKKEMEFVSILFIIPIVIDTHGLRFKIFTLVSDT